MEMSPALKKYWPWAAGGLVGIYIVYKYVGSSSTIATTTSSGLDPAALAYQSQQNQLQAQTSVAMAQVQTQADAQTAAQNLAMSTLNAQSTVANMNAETAYNTALGSTASSVGSSIAQVIQAQSLLPATAINAAMNNNQTALQASAATAIAGINETAAITAVPAGVISSEINQQTAANKDFYTSLTNSGNQVVAANMAAMGNSTQAFGSYAAQASPLIVNSVGTSAASQVSSVATTASNAAAANASSSNAFWGSVGTIGAYALMY